MTAITSPSAAMIVLAGIRRSLAQSTDLEQIHDLRDRSETIRHYVKTVAMGLKIQNQAAEVKLCCERRIGQILAELALRGGDRKSEHRDPSVTLDDLGISRTNSSRWQREGSLPEEEFAQYVQRANEEGRELTSNGLLRLARAHADATRPADYGENPSGWLINGLRNLARQQKRFACIYAKPPWPCGVSKTAIAQLPTRLCSLPVKLIVAPQAHLHLWVPPEELETGLAVLRAWGFRYKAVLVKGTTPLDYGNYWRKAHDMLVLGVRGGLSFRDSSLPSWVEGHGDSATDIHALIARASPPPYLDLFGTAVGTGWLAAAS